MEASWSNGINDATTKGWKKFWPFHGRKKTHDTDTIVSSGQNSGEINDLEKAISAKLVDNEKNTDEPEDWSNETSSVNPSNNPSNSTGNSNSRFQKALQDGLQGLCIAYNILKGQVSQINPSTSTPRTLDNIPIKGNNSLLIKGDTPRTRDNIPIKGNNSLLIKGDTPRTRDNISIKGNNSLLIKGNTPSTLDNIPIKGNNSLLIKGVSTPIIGDVDSSSSETTEYGDDIIITEYFPRYTPESAQDSSE